MSAFFVVLLGSSSATSPIVDVTGVSATGAVGTVAAGTAQQVFLTGVDATGFAGAVAVTADANAAVSGLSASAFVGQAQALAESDIVLTGVSATASPGTLTATGTGFVSLTGVSGQAQLGNESILIGGNITIAVTGLAANGSVGTVNVALLNNVTVSLTGVASTASAGSVVVAGSALTSVTGVSGTATVRPVAVQASVSTSATGVSGTGAVGSLVAQTAQTANVIGVTATGQVSAVTANVTAFVSVNVTGVSGTANVGAVAARTSDDFIVVANTTSPFLHAYEWDNSTGFGAKFADPASVPGNVSGMSLLNEGGTRYLAVSDSLTTTAPFYVYTISGTTGWGSRESYNPTNSNPRAGLEVLWINNPNGNFLISSAAVKSTEDTLYIQKFSSGSFTGAISKVRNASDSAPRSLGYVRLTNTTSAVFYGLDNTPYIKCRVLTDATPAFGSTEYQPTTLPPDSVRAIASYTQNVGTDPRGALFAAHSSSPYVTAYQVVNTSPFFGTKYSNPSSAFGGNATGVAYRSTNNPIGTGEVAAAITSNPYVNAYQWTSGSGFGIKYSNPSTIPTGSGQVVQFNPSRNCVAVGHSTSPFISAYPWTREAGFGSKFSNPVTALGSAVSQVAFSN